MDVTDALYSRYSARAFKPDSVEKETITRILEAATHAPSWANTQPWEIFVAGGIGYTKAATMASCPAKVHGRTGSGTL